MEENTNEQQPRLRTARELRKAKEAEEERKRREEEYFHHASDVTQETQTEPIEEEIEETPHVAAEIDQAETIHTDDVSDPPSMEAESLHVEEGNAQVDWETLQKELEKWKRHAEENEEQLLRSRADYENFRRRARKDQEDAVKYGATSLVESLLPVLDNLERALAVDEPEGENDVFRQGIDMVYRQLLQSLTEKGLSVIETEGKEFNPHEHTAVMQEEAEGIEAGMIIEELQKGYRFKERILRPAMVKVSS
ncbi:nucleotide exchange factor GrpE [Marininema halotolerans]|uniref:Protein GrpE n=1 Tax=Marininema halotolerans TaxID=1155944 RepID=A0A1I6T038_9BACL|nr:nucleotide exchange factor GrpE [Marininema halotolerans]SFS82448.1 molecular chaperone GrpE [Marininema halotolerans]